MNNKGKIINNKGKIMKANELRIGSLVTHEGIDMFRVDEIRQSNEGCVIRMYPCDNLESKMDMFVSLAEPIPLTPEVMEKCGFVKSKLEGYDVHFKYSHHKLHSAITALYNSEFSIKLDDVARGVKSLHQLQSLFFALTGEELPINL